MFRYLPSKLIDEMGFAVTSLGLVTNDDTGGSWEYPTRIEEFSALVIYLIHLYHCIVLSRGLLVYIRLVYNCLSSKLFVLFATFFFEPIKTAIICVIHANSYMEINVTCYFKCS